MSRYARGTSVSSDRSQSEIKRTIRKYGGLDIVFGDSQRFKMGFVSFSFPDGDHIIHVKINIPLPEQEKFALTETGRERSWTVMNREWEKACRQQWRVLLLLVKANLESIENGLQTPTQAFFKWLLLPNGQTVWDMVEPGIPSLLESGKVAKALPFFGKEE